jgi:hypothetical protein
MILLLLKTRAQRDLREKPSENGNTDEKLELNSCVVNFP